MVLCLLGAPPTRSLHPSLPFTSDKLGAVGGEVTCPGSHGWCLAESLASKACNRQTEGGPGP